MRLLGVPNLEWSDRRLDHSRTDLFPLILICGILIFLKGAPRPGIFEKVQNTFTKGVLISCNWEAMEYYRGANPIVYSLNDRGNARERQRIGSKPVRRVC